MPTTTKYIWDDDNYLAEADGSDTINVVYTNEPQQYGNLISTRIASTTSYHHFDAMGSTRQSTSNVGHVADTSIFDAWGNIVFRSGTTPISMLWIGEVGYYFDSETDLFYARARVFGPVTGRWLSYDPIGFVDGMNLFVFAGNAPITYVDPTGLKLCINCADKPESATCGVYSWAATFGGGIKGPGFLIQKITSTFFVKNCKTDKYIFVSQKCEKGKNGPAGSTEQTEPQEMEYWEMWIVKSNGEVWVPDVSKRGEPLQLIDPVTNVKGPPLKGEDPWNGLQGAGDGTKGNVSTSATLYFVPTKGRVPPPRGSTPEGWDFWKQYTGVGQGFPGGLPYSCVNPKIDASGEGVESATRSLSYKWKCCGCGDPDPGKVDGPPTVTVNPKC